MIDLLLFGQSFTGNAVYFKGQVSPEKKKHLEFPLDELVSHHKEPTRS